MDRCSHLLRRTILTALPQAVLRVFSRVDELHGDAVAGVGASEASLSGKGGGQRGWALVAPLTLRCLCSASGLRSLGLTILGGIPGAEGSKCQPECTDSECMYLGPRGNLRLLRHPLFFQVVHSRRAISSS